MVLPSFSSRVSERDLLTMGSKNDDNDNEKSHKTDEITEENEVAHSSDESKDSYRLINKIIQVLILVCSLVYGSGILIKAVNELHFNYNNNSAGVVLKASEISSFAKYTANSKNNTKIPLNFDVVRNNTFRPNLHQFQWIKSPESLSNDKGTYVVDQDNAFIIKSIQDEDYMNVLFNGTAISYEGKLYEVEDIIASPDLKTAIIVTDKKHNWRHSTFGNYFIYTFSDKTIQPLISDLNSRVAVAKWSPLSDKIAYVLDNNVYVHDLATKTARQVTFDGNAEIFNGKPDWVYEEEVFSSDFAMWWSPSGEFLAVLQSNDTQVPEFAIPYYAQQDDENSIQKYPIFKNLKYPKPGSPNPVVDLLMYDVSSDKLTKLDSKDVFYNDDDIDNETRLITEVVWVGDDKVFTKITNRESDMLKIFLIDAKKMTSIVTRSESTSEDGGWFEITQNTLFVPKDASKNRSEDGYIDTITVDGYNHIGYFSPPESSTPQILTKGSWEVVDAPSAFDYESNTVYYISTEKSSTERHLFKLDLLDPIASKQNITSLDEEAWYGASFSSGARYALLTYGGPGVPHQKLVDLHTNTEKVIESNEGLTKSAQIYDVPVTTYGEVELESGVVANYMETTPLNFDPENGHKYPVLFFVYGGPNSQLVTKSYAVSFSQVVAAQAEAIVVTVDGRGTGFKGRDFRSIVHDNLGHYESRDQISAAKHWSSKKYVDSERVAIWGWSYGGFMTLKTMETDGGEVFKYGMSVAPVTNWQFYDSIYTERYMHTPQQNPEGYVNASVANVESISKVNRFLLMHGTGDDNVHFQNSLRVLDLFNRHGVENYDMMVFPDSDHSIRYHNANVIVYDKLLDWIQRAFKGEFLA